MKRALNYFDIPKSFGCSMEENPIIVVQSLDIVMPIQVVALNPRRSTTEWVGVIAPWITTEWVGVLAPWIATCNLWVLKWSPSYPH